MSTEQRFHALDAVRAFALIAGIILHGTMSFLPDLISLKYPIADRSPSMTLEVVFYVIHIFRMSAFFLIAGLFAHLMFHRKGMGAFIRDRAHRIGLPMLFGWVTLAPVTIAIIVLAAYINNGGMAPPPPPPGSQQPLGFPLLHLWFLYYLVIFYVLTLLFREAIVRTIDRSGALRRFADGALRMLVNGYVAPLVFAVPTVVCLYLTPVWPWIGVPTPETGLTPQLPALIAYGTPFVFGWLLHRQTQLLATFERRWLMHLVIAVIASAAAWHIVGAPMGFRDVVPANVKLAYAAVYTLAIWTWVFAVIGIAMKFFSAASKTTRYLADSSYWMYLLHLPLVFGLQTAMMRWNLHWTLKFPLLMVVTFALLLLSYQYLVRNTWVGKTLNGRRYPTATATDTQAQSHA
jgi:glucans biosynthesis protein C